MTRGGDLWRGSWRDSWRDPAALLLLAGCLAGLAHLFLTPPFEGFDETAHYSYAQLVADKGRIPVYGRAVFGEDVVDYMATAPVPPSASVNPADPAASLSYAEAFASPEREGAARKTINDAPPVPRAYAPAGPLNWQAQHPPLAYLLLAPVYQATKGLSWKTHFFALRLFSFLVAMIGLAVGVAATRAYLAGTGDRSAYAVYAPAIMAAWPFYAPMFFPEMARLGNDSFCLLFAGLAWAALLSFLRAGDRARLKWGVLLGLALGMGALTKAFFLPVAAGVGLFLVCREVLRLEAGGRGDLRRLSRALLPVAAMALVFVAIAVWWYAGKLAETGALSGANDLIALGKKGDAGALIAANFSLLQFFRRMFSVYLTFIWAGTWSVAKLPYNAVLMLGLAFGFVMTRYLITLAGERRREAAAFAPVFIVGPVVAGLAWHVITQFAMGAARAGTPGWYLHIFAGPLGFAYAIGAAALLGKSAGRIALALALAYTLGFAAVAELHQLQVFAGCLARVGDLRNYQPAACYGDAAEIWRRLEVVANPAMGAAAFALAAAAFSYGAYRMRSLIRPKPLCAGRSRVP